MCAQKREGKPEKKQKIVDYINGMGVEEKIALQAVLSGYTGRKD